MSPRDLVYVGHMLDMARKAVNKTSGLSRRTTKSSTTTSASMRTSSGRSSPRTCRISWHLSNGSCHPPHRVADCTCFVPVPKDSVVSGGLSVSQRCANLLDHEPRFRGDTGSVSDCCCPAPAQTAERPTCGFCANAGTLVDLHTVKALLNETAMCRMNAAVFYFCADARCPTVYFAADGQRFATTDLRVAVWQKEPAGSRTVCYCFGENEADMRREVERDGSTKAVERVREHIAAGRCACEIRNPRGACCLGDVTGAVKRTIAASEFAG